MADDLQAIAAALRLALSAEQLTALRKYVDSLAHWNATYNLTAVRDRSAMLTHHLGDCLAVVPALRRIGGQGRLLDVGSGGGLPGVVIAIMLPDMDVTCVDAVAKKVAFVRHVAGAGLLANLHARHARVETLQAPAFDVIASRAFGTLSAFTEVTRRHLAPHGVWMAMKGRVPDDEIAALPADVEMFHVEQLSVPGLDAHRCLVWMRKRQSG